MTARDGRGSVAARLRGLERRLGDSLQPGCPDCRGRAVFEFHIVGHGEEVPPLVACPSCGRPLGEGEGLQMIIEDDGTSEVGCCAGAEARNGALGVCMGKETIGTATAK